MYAVNAILYFLQNKRNTLSCPC